MPRLGEEAQDEMEALQSIYQSDLNILSSKAGIPYGYKLEVKPHTALETGEIYCEAFVIAKPERIPEKSHSVRD